ncbi:MAG: DUF4738 domain-containing protein [Bacteroidaceae bacterium]|nr:DUF4738 domain-containing protein [Bacteroidaceae bacterium]
MNIFNFDIRDFRLYLLMRRSAVLIICCLIWFSCSSGNSGRKSQKIQEPPDTAAMHRLQGVWVDAETGGVLLLVHADSIFYPDTINMPASFVIIHDSIIITAGGIKNSYLIVEHGDYNFSYEALTGEVIHMQKSDDVEDSLEFLHRSYAPILISTLLRRDTVAYSPSGERLHLYIDVNPTKKKVFRTTYTDEGMAVSNAYYDNIIHISVYSGRRRVFGSDISKKAFEDLIPDAFLAESILSNMSFGRIDSEGCHFEATVCEPEGASCYVVDIVVSYAGKCTMNIVEY